MWLLVAVNFSSQSGLVRINIRWDSRPRLNRAVINDRFEMGSNHDVPMRWSQRNADLLKYSSSSSNMKFFHSKKK